MKLFLRNIWLGIAAIAALGMTSCGDKEVEPAQIPTPGISISEVKATTTTVTFTLTVTDSKDYAYSVALKGSKGEMIAVTGKTTSTEVVTGLEGEKEYVITAIAYSADKSKKSEEKSHSFVTNPMPKIELGSSIKVGATTATVTLIPTNATSMSYICYKQNERPSTPTWIEIEGNNETIVTIKDLETETTYLVEAFASNDEGDSKAVVSAPFTTKGHFSAMFATTADKASAHFEISSEIKGFAVTDAFPAGQEGSDEELINGLAQGVEGGWVAVQNKSTWWQWSLWAPDAAFVVCTIQVDEEGKVIPSTFKKWDIKSKAENVFNTGVATVEVVSSEAGQKSITAELKLSNDASMFFAVVFSAAQMDAAGFSSPDKYITEGFSLFNGNLYVAKDSEWDQAIRVQPNGNIKFKTEYLTPEVDYWFVTFAVDQNGAFSKMTTKMYKTAAIPQDATVTAVAEAVEVGFVDIKFKVTLTGASKLRGVVMSYENFMSEFGSYKGDEKMVLAELASNEYSLIELADDGTFVQTGLNPGTPCVFFMLPVKEDGTFGKLGKLQKETAKYDVLGTSTVASEVVSLDTNGSEPDWRTFITVKFTPDANCGKYMVAWIGEWEANEINGASDKQAAMVDKALRSQQISTHTASEEVTCEGAAGGRFYIILPCDKDGKWSAPFMSDKIVSPAKVSI